MLEKDPGARGTMAEVRAALRGSRRRSAHGGRGPTPVRAAAPSTQALDRRRGDSRGRGRRGRCTGTYQRRVERTSCRCRRRTGRSTQTRRRATSTSRPERCSIASTGKRIRRRPSPCSSARSKRIGVRGRLCGADRGVPLPQPGRAGSAVAQPDVAKRAARRDAESGTWPPPTSRWASPCPIRRAGRPTPRRHSARPSTSIHAAPRPIAGWRWRRARRKNRRRATWNVGWRSSRATGCCCRRLGLQFYRNADYTAARPRPWEKARDSLTRQRARAGESRGGVPHARSPRRRGIHASAGDRNRAGGAVCTRTSARFASSRAATTRRSGHSSGRSRLRRTDICTGPTSPTPIAGPQATRAGRPTYAPLSGWSAPTDQTPDDPDLQSRLALFLAKSGDTSAALAALDSLERHPPAQGVMLFRIGVAYEVCGARDKALAALQKALARATRKRNARRTRAARPAQRHPVSQDAVRAFRSRLVATPRCHPLECVDCQHM